MPDKRTWRSLVSAAGVAGWKSDASAASISSNAVMPAVTQSGEYDGDGECSDAAWEEETVAVRLDETKVEADRSGGVTRAVGAVNSDGRSADVLMERRVEREQNRKYPFRCVDLLVDVETSAFDHPMRQACEPPVVRISIA